MRWPWGNGWAVRLILTFEAVDMLSVGKSISTRSLFRLHVPRPVAGEGVADGFDGCLQLLRLAADEQFSEDLHRVTSLCASLHQL
jgi:hypothetical protein